MKIIPNRKILSLEKYIFAEVKEQVQKLKGMGIKPIDCGVGDPREPTPKIVREAIKEAVEKRKSSGYPNYIGSECFRQAIAEWTKKRFNVDLDINKEICSTIGAKEAIFNFPFAFIEPGDYVLVPNPSYLPYTKGTLFTGGKVYYMNLLETNDNLPDFSKIPGEVKKKAKIMWLNYPNNPTTAIATKQFYEEATNFGRENNIIVASDECYTDNYYEEKPMSILEISKKGVIVFQSLSKRSNMTCYRVGWVAGDPDIITTFKKLKSNIDSGTATFIQDAAVAALKDEKHVKKNNDINKIKRDMLVNVFKEVGLEDCTPKATIYLWQRVPPGFSSLDFAKELLDPNIALVTIPGTWLSKNVNGANPGEGYIRIALVPTIEECEEATERIRKFLTVGKI